MPLAFSKIEPVVFGDFKAKPISNPTLEAIERARRIAVKTADDLVRAADILSGFFEERDRVRQFIVENMRAYDVLMLKTYLVDGPQAYLKQEAAISEGIRDVMARAKNAEDAAQQVAQDTASILQ